MARDRDVMGGSTPATPEQAEPVSGCRPAGSAVRKHRLAIVLLILGAACLLAGLCQAGLLSAVARLFRTDSYALSPRVIDVGLRRPNERVDATVRVHNRSQVPIRMVGILAACNCVVPRDSFGLVEPSADGSTRAAGGVTIDDETDFLQRCNGAVQMPMCMTNEVDCQDCECVVGNSTPKQCGCQAKEGLGP